ncbi:C6 transcription factor [Pseudohyphozyma bogoriensis]|nr:C6 transcription factor [Pseudohyphozyma bogoriensis]
MPATRRRSTASTSPPILSSPAINKKAKLLRSCTQCHSRKVRCSQETPACAACLKHAKTLGIEPSSVQCEYVNPPSPASPSSLPSPPLLPVEPADGVFDGGGRSLRKTTTRTKGLPFLQRERSTSPSVAVAVDVASTAAFDSPAPALAVGDHEWKLEGLGRAKDTRRLKLVTKAHTTESTTFAFKHQHQLPTPDTSPTLPFASPSQHPIYHHQNPHHSPPTFQPYFTSLFSSANPVPLPVEQPPQPQPHFALRQNPVPKLASPTPTPDLHYDGSPPSRAGDPWLQAQLDRIVVPSTPSSPSFYDPFANNDATLFSMDFHSPPCPTSGVEGNYSGYF